MHGRRPVGSNPGVAEQFEFDKSVDIYEQKIQFVDAHDSMTKAI